MVSERRPAPSTRSSAGLPPPFWVDPAVAARWAAEEQRMDALVREKGADRRRRNCWLTIVVVLLMVVAAAGIALV